MSFAIEFPEAVIDEIAARVCDRLAAEFAGARDAGGEPYLRVAQIAEYASVPKSRVYDWIAKRALKVVYDGRTPLSKRAWVDRMLAEDGAT